MLKKQHVIILSSLGAAMEYYDFILYGVMMPYLSAVFFSGIDPAVDLLKNFSILALGYFVRPIGGCVFGILSDLYGRKKILVIIMSLMTVATLAMGVLPSYATVGIWAPIGLIVCRIVQGLSFGAEMPNITTMIQEYQASSKHANRSGFYYGMAISSTSMGALCAFLVVACLGHYFSAQEIMTWAWRLPFLLGGIFVIAVFVIRIHMMENPIYVESQKKKQLYLSAHALLKDLFQHHKTALCASIGIVLFFSYLILLSLYLPSYLSQYFHYSLKNIHGLMTVSLLISILGAPLFGKISAISRGQILQGTALGFVFFLGGALYGLSTGSYLALSAFLMGYQVFICLFATHALRALSDRFPLPLRTTGIGLSYNIAYSCASIIALGFSLLIHENNYMFGLMGISMGVVTITVIASSHAGTLLNDGEFLTIKGNTHFQ
jgi:MFS family permease